MAENALRFSDIYRTDLEATQKKLDAIRKAVVHPGEKGRALEHQVAALLRNFLPTEYGLSTGFVAYENASGEVSLSPQLDIIIYDAVRGAALVRLGACDVFPLESVFGYVEVKATLTNSDQPPDKLPDTSIQWCLQRNALLRGMRVRRYLRPKLGSTTSVEPVCGSTVPIRGYVFAFDASGNAAKPCEMARVLHEYMQQMAPGDQIANVHLHGLYVTTGVFYETVPVKSGTPKAKCQHIRYVQNDSLETFQSSILAALARCVRPEPYWVPCVDRYVQARRAWEGFPAPAAGVSEPSEGSSEASGP